MIGISAANSLKGVSCLLLLPLQLVVVSPLTLRHISPVHGLDLHRLLNKAGEEQAPGAGSPAIEAEGQLVQVVVEVEWEMAPWWVPSSHRLSREATRWTRGITS